MKTTEARAEVAGTLISDYWLREVEHPRELILLLHGYQQNGQYIFDKLAGSCPENALILAPNAPYPIPERRPDGNYRIGFSWYFYDPAKDDYYIDMKAAQECLSGLVRQLKLESLPKRIIGFSQGGYLAGFVAENLGKVHQIIGVASEYLYEELRAAEALPTQNSSKYRMDSLHGDLDEVVNVESSKRHHAELVQHGVVGEFVSLAGQSHRFSAEMQAGVKRLLGLSSPSS